jgi:DNA-directed RNA polymerase specialized sigma24 family protein
MHVSHYSPRQAPLTAFQSDVIDLKPALMAFARKLHRNEVDSEDLVQETFAKAFLNQEKFETGTT